MLDFGKQTNGILVSSSCTLATLPHTHMDAIERDVTKGFLQKPHDLLWKKVDLLKLLVVCGCYFFIVDSDSVDQKNTPLATALSP